VEQGVSRIIVKNTAENLAMIEKKIDQLNATETTQVLTQVKFVEVAMNDLEELGFEYVLARNNDGSHTIAYEPINTNYQTVVDPTSGNVSTENVPYIADESFTLVYKPTYSSSSTTILNGVQVTNKMPSSGSTKTEVIEKGAMYTIPQDGVYYKAPLNLTSIYGSSVTFGANNSLVRNAQTSTSAFSPSGVVTNDTVVSWSHSNKKGYDMSAKMHALDQADSTDILSAPRLTTISGSPAVIKMVTEKYYPDEWDEAELETVSGEGDNDDIPVFQPSIPTFGDATEEGIVLSIQPTVEDNYTITIPMTPTIQEFVGWTDYSYDIPLEANNETRYYPNTLKMPIIESRSINTVVVSYDGETVVMGGVIRDRIAIVEDQYPILGDLPLVGRLFQSKGRGSEKVSLLIFLNNRLIKPDGSPIRENQERGVPSFRY
jgi:type II secretory pathway component GspD/PulD (secretin)